ncbi:protein of unknown function [Acidithiobacillus ferrivorans]|uniref:Uncharacterized protein n=1 Tax=Acidithiobacillus ferrivorans TaxID=160808 RepID=A0ABY1MU67_9PROT|nr:protein of unknown function [Acidithiobacillus ferrivorans]
MHGQLPPVATFAALNTSWTQACLNFLPSRDMEGFSLQQQNTVHSGSSYIAPSASSEAA